LINDILRKTYCSDEISSENFETFSTKDAVVWIDPLDGTQDFVNGNLTAVTVLIGLSLANKSRIGIVHKPFSDED
jgi:3'(2'), 5'-bisphosphate nucleotidase